jgi:hypothetical protein
VRAADVVSLANRRFVLALFGITADLIQLLCCGKVKITFLKKRKIDDFQKYLENTKNSDV